MSAWQSTAEDGWLSGGGGWMAKEGDGWLRTAGGWVAIG
jgi:hypothetical protein